jgi:iron(III) transport system permease protein
VGRRLFLVYALRMAGRGCIGPLPLTLIGYAAPGAVLALGLLFPLAALDHRLADGLLALTGHDPGLMITGTALGLGLAYLVRFFGIAQGALECGFRPGVAGRCRWRRGRLGEQLGRDAGLGLYAADARIGATALLVVFVDCVKELPATLLLRPFNYNTLSTRVYELASLERLSEAAPCRASGDGCRPFCGGAVWRGGNATDGPIAPIPLRDWAGAGYLGAMPL